MTPDDIPVYGGCPTVVNPDTKITETSKLNCEVLHEPLGYEARWAIAGDSIVVQLVAKLELNQYMSFGISGSPTTNRMIGGDVVVAGVDQDTISGFAQDYYLLDKSQCVVQQETGQVSGSCPDSNIQGPDGESVRLLNAAIVNGYSIVTYQRPLNSKDNLDLSISTNKSQPIIWAVGPLNDKREVSYHPEFSKETVRIDFGRSPEWNCPIPDTDAKSDVVHNEVTTAQSIISDITTSQSSVKEVTPTKKIRPRPVSKPAPVQNHVAWEIPAIQCYEPDDGVFYAQMGPTGGKHGYSAITGHVGWGISWYINGLLIPEINVVRGQTYTFVVEGGHDSEIPAKYHPFYITDDSVGGYGYKTAEERENIRIFAGVSVSKSGEVIPTGVGRSCNWTPDPQQPPADEFVSFGAYQRTLTLVCENGDPGIVQWTPDAETPDTVYYQCFTHRHLGWKINVLDSCDKEQPGAEPSASASEDLQSRGSIQYTTRIKPDANNERFYGEPGKKNHVDPRTAVAKDHHIDDHNMPPIPPVLEENLRNDFPKSQGHRDSFVFNDNNNYQFPVAAASQQNVTSYAYHPASSNHTAYGGDEPFYTPKVHYGSPRPVKTAPVHSYNVNNNNNYRPVRQPAVPHFHVQQQPANVLQMADPHPRPVQMIFTPKQQVAVKHGYRVQSGKRLPGNGVRHSVVYKKPVYKMYNSQPAAVRQPSQVHHGPASPVPQLLSSGFPGNFQPHQPPFVQQQQQQPTTSMSQSVSVSYSTSKHLQRPNGGHAPIQSRQETFRRPSHRHRQPFQGGFDPNTVVVEGGFKPILQPNGDGSAVLQDRSDGDGESTAPAVVDVDGTPDVETHHGKKMAKKLISRKPAAKHVDDVAKNNGEQERRAGTATTGSAAEDVENKIWTVPEEKLKQTTEPIVV